MTRLNIGSGSAQLDGFTNLDRKTGQDAFPLAYPDNSIEEIRCSHLLEHFNFADAKKALAEWVRVLKPGGVAKISVPDFDKIAELKKTDPKWRFYLCGGQTDGDDQHLSTWDEKLLRAFMDDAGFEAVAGWPGDPRDTSSHPCSLNLQGTKAPPQVVADSMPESFARELPPAPGPGKKRAKICAVISCPRLGWNDMWGETMNALYTLAIPLRRFTGAYWGQCIQNILEDLIKEDFDLALTLDYDSVFTADHVDRLLRDCVADNDIDALAALQVKRNSKFPLLTAFGKQQHEINGKPFLVSTAHFGLTVIRLDALKDIPKPWFRGQPDKTGGWRGDDRMDADIWFWHQWRLAGRKVFVDPAVSVGHLEIMVNEFDENLKARHVTVSEWREAHQQKVKTE